MKNKLKNSKILIIGAAGFTGGFFAGSVGGAIVAYVLLNNIAFFA